MTWHLGGRLSAVTIIVAASLATGCGSSSNDASIELTTPEKGAQLTLKTDDLDPDLDGLQYDVKATSKGVAAGTAVLLTIEDVSEASITMVTKDGSITFPAVNLPPGKHTMQVRTASGNVSSADDYDYTYKALVIDSPKDGNPLGIADDKDSTVEGIQINVTVTAYAVQPSEEISLWLDDADTGKTAVVNATTGKALFTGITLSTGSHKLKVVSGSVESNDVRVSVNEGCANVDWVSPAKPSDGDRLTLGGGDKCPKDKEDFTLEVVVSTDAGENRDVELRVNGQTVQTTKVKGALARFPDVVLNHYSSENQLAVVVQGAQGVTCKEVPFPADVYLDCDGPDCAITSPVAKAGSKGDGSPALYINKSALNGTNFDVKVGSDSSVLGKSVQLIIDGEDRRALSADPGDIGDDKAETTFEGVKLTDGDHTLEARCEDNTGNVRYSGALTWSVDTKACTVEVAEPDSGYRYVTGDDTDSNIGGTQVEVKSTVGGDDCARARGDQCTPADGISGVAFEPFDGNSTLITPVTLESSADQTLCVEVEDRAGNVALASVDVHYRSDTPNVKIENPADGAKFNIAGGNGYQMDSDGSSPTICNSNIDVACSELDKPVELHRGDPGATVFATADCVAPANGDPELPAGGFNGRAKFSNVAFLVPGSDTVTIVATQTVSGSSSDTLVGMSAVDLEGVCTAPSISWDQGCPPAQIEIPQGGGTVNYPVLQANYSGTASAAPTSATLTVSGSTSGAITGSPHTATYDAANHWFRFTTVVYGNTAEDITSTFTAVDRFDNTKTIECVSKLVVDLPALTLSAPDDNASFGPGNGCTPSGGGSYGVRFNYMIDQTAMRTLVYQVGSAAEVTVPLSGVSNNVCVPVAEGANTVKLTLRATSGGSADVTRHVTVKSLVLTAPTVPSGQTEASIATDQCTGTGSAFDAKVIAQVDPIHNGKTFSITGGGGATFTAQVAGGAIDACVAVTQGQHTLTVSIDGTLASAQVNVVVITTGPTFDVPITGRTLPTDANYRTGAVNLAWNPNMNMWGWPTQLQSYQLHCASSELLSSASDGDKATWWGTTSHNVPLPNDLKPPTATANIPGLHIGQKVNCVMRGVDGGNNLTALTGGSFEVDYPWRTKSVTPAVDELASMGFGLAQIGDVNGDGHNDVLVGGLGISGGSGRAYLYFGGATPADLSNTPDVTIIGGDAGPAFYEFGSRITGIGDFNQDGRPDFAVGYPGYSSTSPALTRSGAIYVFYGKAQGSAWNSTIDVTTACNADVCFFGDESLENFGYALSGAGHFDQDGFADIAVSSIARDVGGDTSAGRVYVLLNNNYPSGTSVRVPSGDPFGFYVDASGASVGTNPSTQLGQALAPVGNIDGSTGDEILVTSSGDGGSINARLFQIAGRAHNRQSPLLKPIPTTDLIFKDSGPSGAYGLQLTPLRNLANRSNKTNVADVAVYQSNAQPHTFFVYLGDDGFSAASKIDVQGEGGTGFGNSISATFNPGLSPDSWGDLNGDSHDELLVGGAYGNTTPSDSYIFYSDATTPLLETQNSNQLPVRFATVTGPAGDADSIARYVQYVGDMTGDGAIDIVASDPFANGGRGTFFILY